MIMMGLLGMVKEMAMAMATTTSMEMEMEMNIRSVPKLIEIDDVTMPPINIQLHERLIQYRTHIDEQ